MLNTCKSIVSFISFEYETHQKKSESHIMSACIPEPSHISYGSTHSTPVIQGPIVPLSKKNSSNSV